jgi:signal transduction histidine kinase
MWLAARLGVPTLGAMLREFIDANRGELLARTRAKVAMRMPQATLDELKNGVPLFLNQLIEALRVANPSAETIGAIGKSAAQHGSDMLKMGFTVAQVVRGYGDLCQAVTELANETNAPITVEEFHTLNRCLDDATAEAVTEYTRLREDSFIAGEAQRSVVLAHELRNRVSAATLAFSILRKGKVAVNGSVGTVVARNLRRLSALIDRSLIEANLDPGSDHRQRVALCKFVEEAEVEGSLEAAAHHLGLRVGPVERGVFVDVDPHILSGAVANLLDNAFKFTPLGGHVSLKTSATTTRVLIDVEDECGGLPLGKAEELVGALERRGSDQTGLGLGLFICRKGVEASGGVIRVRDIPRAGCIFTIDLPRLSL